MSVAALTSAFDQLLEIFGRAATYAPPSGTPTVACTVLFEENPGRDSEVLNENVKLGVRTATIKVKGSAVTPENDGTFTIGTNIWVVEGPPAEAIDYYWRCDCRLAARDVTADKRAPTG